MSTKARSGKGTIFSIGTDAAALTAVAEIKSIKQSGRKNEMEEVTSLDSTAKEYINGLPDNGEYDMSGNFVSGDQGQGLLETAFTSGGVYNCSIALPKMGTQTKGDTWTFSAVVTELNYSVDTKVVTFDCKIKVSGPITFTPATTA